MKIQRTRLAVAILLVLGMAHRTAAQSLVDRAFDVLLEGDDPFEDYTFNVPGSPLVQSVVRFDGSFENLAPLETGVRYDLWWSLADGSGFGGFLGIDFARLPGGGRLPVQFEELIGFTPATLTLHVEGGGPSDYFRFVGDFALVQVPEPGTFALLATAVALGMLGRRSGRTRTGAALQRAGIGFIRRTRGVI